MSERPQSSRSGASFAAVLRGALQQLTPREQLSALLLAGALLALHGFDYGATTLACLEQSSQRALAAFAIARGLNAVISVIQSAEVGLTVGISAALSPGEVLDPLNDLIERFSLVMLVASVALWLVRLCGGLLFEASLLWGVTLLFLGSLALCRSGHAWGRGLGWLLQWGSRLFLAALLFALATPLLVEAVHDAGYVERQYRASSDGLRGTQQRLESLSRQIDGGAPTAETPCGDWSSCIGERVSRFAETLSGASRVAERIETFARQAGQVASDASQQVVIQIAIFLLETLLLPLAVMLLCWRLLLR
ncbi:MAG: hypothetical protein KDI68_00350 [Gammaproteobacteria bacterium]|nr:hypothetical protein [Gammaproteobacteria bacterium]